MISRKCAFTVQREHAESQAWLTQVAPDFGIAIINPGTLTRTHVDSVRAALRKPKLVLLYENLLDATWMVYGSAHDMRRRQALQEAVVPGWFTYSLQDGTKVPGYVLRPKFAGPLGELDLQRVAEIGCDGVYPDQSFPRWPQWVRQGLAGATPPPGAAYVQEAAEDVIEGRLLHSRILRAGLPNGTIIPNTKTRSFDPAPSGIALESVTDVSQAASALLRYPSGRSIIWENSDPAVIDVLSQLDMVWIGTFIPPPGAPIANPT